MTTTSATEIFIQFEKSIIEWGKKHQKVKVGETVVVKNESGRRVKYKISNVFVTIGRNAKQTCLNTLVMGYIGRKINAKGVIVLPVGSGRLLTRFYDDNNEEINPFAESDVTEINTTSGLSFEIEAEQEAIDKYPNAHGSYQNPYFDFRYPN